MTSPLVVLEAFDFYQDKPYEFFIDILEFEPTPQQKQVLTELPKALENKKNISVKSGHGTGKTAIEAGIIIWFLATRPNSKVIATAPTQRQLFDVLWTELSKWHNKSKIKEEFNWTKTHFENKKKPTTWFAVARTSNKPENMQGFHAENLLFIIDEASGVPQEIIETIEGSQTQKNNLIIMFGNPTQITGGFYDSFHTKRKFYKTFTFNTEDCAKDRPDVADMNYAENIAAKYGRDSDIYRVRVLGEFPKAEPDTLIPLNIIEAAITRELDPVITYEDVELGCDIARFGDDETCIYSRIKNEIKEEKIIRGRDLMTVTGEIVMIANKYKGKRIKINIDDSGLGGGVTDRLRELVREGTIRADIYAVNNGSVAKEENFVNVGSEMWNYMREWLKTGKIPNDNDLIAQLSSRKYGVQSKGKIEIEQKKHMKERGLTSPDRADAAILTLRSLIYGNIDRRIFTAVA